MPCLSYGLWRLTQPKTSNYSSSPQGGSLSISMPEQRDHCGVAPEVGGKAILIREYGIEENYPFKANRKSWTMKHLSCSPFSSHQNCVYKDRIIRKVGLRLETFRMPDGNLSNNHSASSLIYLYSSYEKKTQVREKEWEGEKKAPPKIKTATITNCIFYFWLNMGVQ